MRRTRNPGNMASHCHSHVHGNKSQEETIKWETVAGMKKTLYFAFMAAIPIILAVSTRTLALAPPLLGNNLSWVGAVPPPGLQA